MATRKRTRRTKRRTRRRRSRFYGAGPIFSRFRRTREPEPEPEPEPELGPIYGPEPPPVPGEKIDFSDLVPGRVYYLRNRWSQGSVHDILKYVGQYIGPATSQMDGFNGYSFKNVYMISPKGTWLITTHRTIIPHTIQIYPGLNPNENYDIYIPTNTKTFNKLLAERNFEEPYWPR